VLVALMKLALFLTALGVAVALSAWFTIEWVTEEKEVVVVPDLLGLDTRTALGRVNDVGLILVTEDPEQSQYNDRIPRDHIVRQVPSPGTRLKTGRRVRVALSLGPHASSVPLVQGRQVSEAQIRLNDGGLRVGDLVYVHSSEAPENVVIDQEPSQEAGIHDGVVNLLVSAGRREPVYVMPDLINRNVELGRAFLEERGFKVKVDYESYPGLPEGTIVRQKPLGGHPLRGRDIAWLWASRGGGSL
jgi:serine/threonine-protein kinase